MRKIMLYTLLILLTSTLQTHGAVFNSVEKTLANGLKIVVIENHRAPVVHHMLWYKAGAADDPPGKSGIAHFLEHLMFKGTTTLDAGEFSKTVARHGGRDNAFTSYDYTAYHQTIAADKLEMVMAMEADRMQNLKIAPSHFIPEKDVVLEERNSRVENDPATRLSEEERAVFFHNHPYGRPVIGWRHEIEALELGDAIDFYKKHYIPDNAILVVSGDVHSKDVIALAQKYYGLVPASSRQEKKHSLQRVPAEANRTIVLKDSRVALPFWTMRIPAPTYFRNKMGVTGENNQADEALALQIVLDILTGGNSGKLHHALVVEEKVALFVGASYNPYKKGLGDLLFYFQPTKNKTIEEVQGFFLSRLDDILFNKIEKKDVDIAKQRLLDRAVLARDSLDGPAYLMGLALSTGAPVSFVESWPERVENMTYEKVRGLAQRIFNGKQGRVYSHLLPEGGILE